MPRAYVALGSNLGDRHAHLALARDRLARLPGTVLLGASPIDETAPLGGLDQPLYLNQMVVLDTSLAPRALLEACQRIEAEAGRRRRERWASRTLDLDLVRYGDTVMDEPGLTLPHPALGQRPFWQEELDALGGQAGDPMKQPGSAPALPTWARVRPKRLAHVERVVALVSRWGSAMVVPGSELDRWLRAAWLHDALRDAPPEELARWAPDLPGPVELLHGPASAARAEAEGESDRGVLDAVRYHSLGFAGWDRVGRVLYCADFLEPGRSFDRVGRAALANRFSVDPDGVLYEVARRRLAYSIEFGWSIPEPTYRFWNSLAQKSPGE